MTQGSPHADRKYSAPAAACAGEVLRLLARSTRPLSLTDIDRQLPRTKSLVFRVLRELEHQQLIERDGDRYRLGIESFELGAAYLSQAQFLDVVRQVLRQLADDAGETVNLGVLRELEVLYLLKYVGRSTYVTISNVGGRVPANCVAIGKAVLAELTDSELVVLLADQDLPRMTPNSLTDHKRLVSELHKTRNRGYAIDEEECVLGRCGLAVAVRISGATHDHAAISLSTSAEEWNSRKDTLLSLLLTAQERINKEADGRKRAGEIASAL